MICPTCKNPQAHRIFGTPWMCDECADRLPTASVDQVMKNVKKSQDKLGDRYEIVPPDRKRGIAGGVFMRDDGKPLVKNKTFYMGSGRR